MESPELAKRHGSPIHVEVANTFAVVALCLFALYSVAATVSLRYRLKTDRVFNIVKSPIFLTLLWTALCVAAIFWHFQASMLQIARRYGQLSIASATISVVLSLKPAPLPQTFHVPLVSIHKWVGRSSILFASIHGFTYAISFIKQASSSTEKRHEGHHHNPFSTFNIFGMISLAAFIIILVSSLKFVRRRAYGLFYALHRPLVILIYILMIWHARPSSPLLIGVGLAVMAAQIIIRALLTCRLTVTNVEQFGTNLKLVSFKCDSGFFDLGTANHPGSYIRVAAPIFSPLEFFRPSHPYTLAGNGTLVVRESRFILSTKRDYCAFGPFYTPLDLTPSTKVLIIAGGSGISMAPTIVNKAQSECRLVWVTRSASEVQILPRLGIKDCDVFITGDTFKDEEAAFELDDIQEEEEIENENENENENEEEQSSFLSNSVRYGAAGIHRHRGRPNLDEAAKSLQDPNVLIIACGPESLVNDVRLFATHHNYTFWSEVYAL